MSAQSASASFLRIRLGIACLLLALLGGCLGHPFTQPPGLQCAAFLHDAEGGIVADKIARMADRRTPGSGPVDVNLLILSGGGKYGAYGAGFLSGWSRREARGTVDLRRQDVDIVTGISTGSLLASYAAVGNGVAAGDPRRAQADTEMRAAYQVSDKDLFVEHGLIGSIHSNALADPAKGLQRRVDALARAYIPLMRALPAGRAVLVGLVNLDNGRFYVADLVEIARSDRADAADCYREMLLASSAVPLQFPPRFIGGSPYVDGGGRFGTFLGRDFARLAARPGAGGGPPVPVRINFRAIINGNLSANDPAGDAAKAAACDAAGLDEIATACPRVKNRLIDIAKRAASDILVDQLYRDSAYRLYRDLDAMGLLGSGLYTYVSNPEIAAHDCKRATKDNFDRAYMDCLSRIGAEKGEAQTWQTFDDIPKVARPDLAGRR